MDLLRHLVARNEQRVATGRVMPKAHLLRFIAADTGLKAADCKKVFASLVAVGTNLLKHKGKLTIPGLATLTLKTKPATKAGKKMMFGKVVDMKAKPAQRVIKAFAVPALKKSI